MQYQTKLSAGLDLCATEVVFLPPLRRAVADTGVYLKDVMPTHMLVQVTKFNSTGQFSDVPFAMVCSRSGLAAREGIIVLNAPGIIDADYEETIKVILFNTSDQAILIAKGDRIAQLVFAYAYRRSELVKDEVRQGGLGSTGTGETLAGSTGG